MANIKSKLYDYFNKDKLLEDLKSDIKLKSKVRC